jgi:hypothetical protein
MNLQLALIILQQTGISLGASQLTWSAAWMKYSVMSVVMYEYEAWALGICNSMVEIVQEHSAKVELWGRMQMEKIAWQRFLNLYS